LLAGADEQAGGESGVGWIDAMIAAVGEGYDEPVLTENVEDFERLGVEVEKY
jgi:predicted nucleic acid-binding protein